MRPNLDVCRYTAGLPTTEEHFAETLTLLMEGEVSADEAVRRWAGLCRRGAAGLREQSGGQLQRAARYMHLRDEARLQLEWSLHGSRLSFNTQYNCSL